MMKRHLLGPKSEKMPRVKDELRKDEATDEAAVAKRKAEAAATRKERANARKAALAKKTTQHSVPKSERQCPKCGGENLKAVSAGKESVVYEYVPGHFIAHHHVRETLACPCGEHMVTADGPTKSGRTKPVRAFTRCAHHHGEMR